MSNASKEYKGFWVNGPLHLATISPEEVIATDHMIMIILLGPTGAGKSSFLESLSPDQHLNISKNSLESVTQEVNCYRVVNLSLFRSGKGWCFVFMDTPGFLDPKLSESRITKMITESLDAFCKYARDISVNILYFQPITDIRIGGSKRLAFKMFREYVKPYSARSITVITTMWNALSTPKQLEDANCRFDSLRSIW
ncbi:hypothetical protein BJ165DRAFT_364060 [Panaeolus papilionaceus]|nr:hypothetical protein BJ165DRAFT_364060 [Panaeolus papilionaceus]